MTEAAPAIGFPCASIPSTSLIGSLVVVVNGPCGTQIAPLITETSGSVAAVWVSDAATVGGPFAAFNVSVNCPVMTLFPSVDAVVIVVAVCCALLSPLANGDWGEVASFVCDSDVLLAVVGVSVVAGAAEVVWVVCSVAPPKIFATCDAGS